ncbi:hypothetical protein HK097_008631 [Rhizophlyctis rosea]|uniref:Amino acid transporter transmembrane domain-containing protein n=1 Tax=Rhizophlyctis rosea TaxID=64517 RepID=A0AAD5SBM1_9FUNG|nr:hypothetical protein HK097_008631 [Rhizophlyctis rosea]
MSAFMNISYTFIGQITLPSFISEMENPKDFPKTLWACTILEIFLFSIVGGVIYAYTGTNYNTAPAFGSIGNELYKMVSFSFMIPILIFLGVLYAVVTARFIFQRIFRGTRHLGNHTVVGDLLSLMSSLFDSFFGFIFWGVAFFRIKQADYGYVWWKKSVWNFVGLLFNIFICLVGLLFLAGGTYASVQSIVDGYRASTFGFAFSCKSNGL